MLSHLLERVEPSHILVAFDAGKTTFRTEMYADYKGGRAKTPDEFREQFPFIRELLDHMGFVIMSWLSMKQMISLGHWIN